MEIIDVMRRPSDGEIAAYMRRRAAEHYDRAERQGNVADAEYSRGLAQLCEAAAATLERRGVAD